MLQWQKKHQSTGTKPNNRTATANQMVNYEQQENQY